MTRGCGRSARRCRIRCSATEPSFCWSSSATDDGTAAPRLAQQRPEPDELAELWSQAVSALELLASEGLAHGDLSAFNVLVHAGG